MHVWMVVLAALLVIALVEWLEHRWSATPTTQAKQQAPCGPAERDWRHEEYLEQRAHEETRYVEACKAAGQEAQRFAAALREGQKGGAARRQPPTDATRPMLQRDDPLIDSADAGQRELRAEGVPVIEYDPSGHGAVFRYPNGYVERVTAWELADRRRRLRGQP